jgi:predicted DNA-binding transcriptional regulator AlpA
MRSSQTAFPETPPRTPPAPDDLLSSYGVRHVLGGISEMSLWRYSNDDRFAFPKPDLIIARRKFWRRATVQRWIAAQEKKHAVEAAS